MNKTPSSCVSPAAGTGQSLANALLSKFPNTQIVKTVQTSQALPVSSTTPAPMAQPLRHPPITATSTVVRPTATASIPATVQRNTVPAPATQMVRNKPVNVGQKVQMPSSLPPPLIDAAPALVPQNVRVPTSVRAQVPEGNNSSAHVKKIAAAPAISLPINSQSVGSLVSHYKRNDWQPVPMPEESGYQSPPRVISPPPPKKSSPEDPKVIAKLLPSLSVVVKEKGQSG